MGVCEPELQEITSLLSEMEDEISKLRGEVDQINGSR